MDFKLSLFIISVVFLVVLLWTILRKSRKAEYESFTPDNDFSKPSTPDDETVGERIKSSIEE